MPGVCFFKKYSSNSQTNIVCGRAEWSREETESGDSPKGFIVIFLPLRYG